MKKDKLLIDVDEVVCYDGYLALVNEFLKTNYTYSDVKDYYVDDLVPDEIKDKWWDFLLTKNNYDYAEILPNAYEVIKKLNKNYDIYICTACVNPFFIKESGDFYKNKYNWIITNFDFLEPNNFIFTNAKNIIQADIQIDDKLSNLMGDVKCKLLFEAYHNKKINEKDLEDLNVIRVKDWKEVEKILYYNNLQDIINRNK